MKTSVIALAVVLAVGAWFRLHGLADERPGMYADEVLYGYDGWSIAKTGTDHRQTGRPPLYLTGYSSHWDNRTSVLYPYVLAGLFSVFPPSLFLVRLPAVVAGLGLILVIYHLCRQLIPAERRIALVAAALTAIAPVAVAWSRIGHDPIVAALAAAGTLLAIAKTRDRPYWWFAAGALVGLGLYGYQTFKLIGPAFWLLGLWYVWPSAKRQWPWIIASVFLGAAIAGPLVVTQIRNWQAVQGEFNQILFWHKPYPAFVLARNVINYLFTGYLFSPRLIYPFATPLAIYGLVVGWRNHRRAVTLLLSAMALSFVPGLITESLPVSPAATARVISSVGLLEILAGVGLVAIIERWRRSNPGWLVFTRLALAIIPLAGLTVYLQTIVPVACCPKFDGLRQMVDIVTADSWRDRPVVFHDANHAESLTLLWMVRFPPADFLRGPVGWTRFVESRGLGEYPSTFGRYTICKVEQCFRPHDGKLYVMPARYEPQLPALYRLPLRKLWETEDWKIVDNS